MDDPQFSYRMYKIKEKEWLEEAERIRISRQNRSSRKMLQRWICFLLNHTGNLLGSWGLSLQKNCRVAL
jgi:hypothetical protein